MGMFNDHVHALRTSWEYTFTGSELLPAAEKQLTVNSQKEREAREETAKLLLDVNVSQNDSRFAELKKAITKHGELVEQLHVFIMEFKRSPDRVFRLGLGDVTFFELTT